MFTRRIRSLLTVLCVLAALVGPRASVAQSPKNDVSSVEPNKPLPLLSKPLPPLFDTLQERTFRYFWDNADPDTGLVPDRYPTSSFSSIAAVGFALTAYPIGVERQYVTRAAAR